MISGPAIRHTGVCAALLAALWLTAGSAGSAPGEYQLKAVFLYNFTQYVSWPQDAFEGLHSPFHLCLLGQDPFDILLDLTVEGQSVEGHPIQVRRLTDLKRAGGCHMLFLGPAPSWMMPQVIDWSLHWPALTISEAEGFAAAGGGVELATRKGRIHLLINRAALRRSRLEANANLLRLADIVEEEP